MKRTWVCFQEVLQKDKVSIGTIAVDAIFTPIRRVNYEVENMRVGERTDYNRLRISIETDGSISPKEALEKSIDTMINQLKSIVGFKEEETKEEEVSVEKGDANKDKFDSDFLKTRIETIDFSQRTLHALQGANVRTVGGLIRKKRGRSFGHRRAGKQGDSGDKTRSWQFRGNVKIRPV